ncbi:N-acetyltransferase family protein [Salinibacterium sp. ZJ70]|uniref:GNAT family N-acetyltransferase n=1 Tax=Salinibacterium sp. ZJ70 TaxID=2708084 RepID=UPI00351CAC5F
MTTGAVRPAAPRDADELAELHVETWRQTYAHLLPPDFFSEAHLDARRDMWRAALGAEHHDIIRVAEHDSRIVGFAWVGESSEEDRPFAPRQLKALYVDAALHGSGVGQRLFDAVRGEGPLVLWVLRDNARAIAFYERNGFRRDGFERPTRTISEFVICRMVRAAQPAAPSERLDQ